MIFIESWLLRVGFPSSINLHTSINSATGKIKPPFWKGPDSLKRKDVHFGVDLSFSENLHLHQADVCTSWLWHSSPYVLFPPKRCEREDGFKFCDGEMLKIVLPCPRKIPWVFSFLTCVTDFQAWKYCLSEE